MKKYLLLLSFIIGTASAMECDAELDDLAQALSAQPPCIENILENPLEYSKKFEQHPLPLDLQNKIRDTWSKNNKLTPIILSANIKELFSIKHKITNNDKSPGKVIYGLFLNQQGTKILTISQTCEYHLAIHDFAGNLLAEQQKIPTYPNSKLWNVAIILLQGDQVQGRHEELPQQCSRLGFGNSRPQPWMAVQTPDKENLVTIGPGNHHIAHVWKLSDANAMEQFLQEKIPLNQILLLAAIEEKVAKKKKFKLDSSTQELFNSMHPLIQKELKDKGYVRRTLIEKFKRLPKPFFDFVDCFEWRR